MLHYLLTVNFALTAIFLIAAKAHNTTQQTETADILNSHGSPSGKYADSTLLAWILDKYRWKHEEPAKVSFLSALLS
jgi:hypothetical protein